MNITLIQTNIIWADKQANLQKTEEKIAVLAGKTDLVVLPEMFTTGFCTDNLELAETMEGETVQTLISWAIQYDFAITGSFITTENGNIYNRAIFVFPSGEIKTADKRHLFSVGDEDKFFKAGNNKLIVNYKNFNICTLVCYDVRFPVWSRNVNNEYDLLIYVANFPRSRMNVWDTLLRARAIENSAYVCGVNRIGTDGMNIAYSGHSTLIDYKGNEILGFSENEENEKTIDIQTDKLKEFRNKNAYWKDADKFEIE